MPSLQPSVCALCHRYRPVCQSHITPEFFIRIAANWDISGGSPKPRLSLITSNRKEPDIEETAWQKVKGLVRERLLCVECERRINHSETYVRRVLFGNQPYSKASKHVIGIRVRSPIRQHGRFAIDELRIEYVDFELFRRFELSLLWRAAVSSLERYEEVNLAAEHQEQLRSALLGDAALPAGQFGCELLDFRYPGIPLEQGIDHPRTLRRGSMHFVLFIMCGWGWLFWVEGNPPKSATDMFLDADGRRPVQVTTAEDMLRFWARSMQTKNSTSAP